MCFHFGRSTERGVGAILFMVVQWGLSMVYHVIRSEGGTPGRAELQDL